MTPDGAIDLRSDTATRPSPEMRRAIAAADVGDEQRREDPTVLELERLGAELLGQPAAVYLPTATMANQIALRILSRPGQELLAEESAHVLAAELGGAAVHSGLAHRPLPGTHGRFTADQVRGAIRDWGSPHTPRPAVVAIEDTHNASGGCYWRTEEMRAVVAAARDLGLRLHLDGSRLFNGAVARGEAAAGFAAPFDTVTICLSKGLGAPLGALLAGSDELIAEARINKHLFGGAMRQAGIVAAGGLYALRHNIVRLGEDHARARRLAEGLAAAGVAVVAAPETNFVLLDLGDDRTVAQARLREHGVLLSGTIDPRHARAVLHLDITDADVERAIERIPRALGARAGAASH